MKKIAISLFLLVISAFAYATTDVNIVGFTVADGNFTDDVTILGNLGIGKTNPLYSLDLVSEASPVDYAVFVSSQDGKSMFKVKGDGSIYLGSDTGAVVSTISPVGALTTPGAITSLAGLTGTTGNFSSTLNADGAVTLNNTLDVDGNWLWGAMNFRSTGTANNGSWAVTGGITSLGALAGTTLNTGQGANELYAMNQNVLTTSSPTFGGLYVLSGNTGIGTITPGAKLEVAGANTFSVDPSAVMYQEIPAGVRVTVSSSAAIVLPNSAGAKLMLEYHNDDGYWSALEYTVPSGSDKANVVILKSGGNVGIGTTNPTQALVVVGTATVSGIILPSSPTDGTLLCFTSGGGVGKCSGSVSGVACTCLPM